MYYYYNVGYIRSTIKRILWYQLSKEEVEYCPFLLQTSAFTFILLEHVNFLEMYLLNKWGKVCFAYFHPHPCIMYLRNYRFLHENTSICYIVYQIYFCIWQKKCIWFLKYCRCSSWGRELLLHPFPFAFWR